jgi:hypothetical protein
MATAEIQSPATDLPMEAPTVPGSYVPGYDVAPTRKTPVADGPTDGPTESMAFAAPGLQPGWQPIANWCTAPSPAYAGNTHTVHFYLNHVDNGIGYQGLFFYQPATPPFTYFSRNRFYGVGHVYPNVPWGELYKSVGSLGNLPAPWLRIVIALRSRDGIAGLTFHEAGGPGALPGTQVGWAEEDVREPLGAADHAVTGLGRWVLYMDFTTALLGT